MLGNYRDKLDDKHTVHSEYLVACKMKKNNNKKLPRVFPHSECILVSTHHFAELRCF